MPLVGQASGDWTESSSALRILYRGVSNSIGVLTDDSFTQQNPPVVTTAGTISTQLTALGLDLRRGVLSGSVCFARPDAGSNFVGGPVVDNTPGVGNNVRALGCFINTANGNAYENLPGIASGKGPYVSSQGSYGNALFETQLLVTLATNAALPAGTALTYTPGQELVASRNGYLMPRTQVIGGVTIDIAIADVPGGTPVAAEANSLEGFNVAPVTTVGVLKMIPDAEMNEIVYDQRI